MLVNKSFDFWFLAAVGAAGAGAYIAGRNRKKTLREENRRKSA